MTHERRHFKLKALPLAIAAALSAMTSLANATPAPCSVTSATNATVSWSSGDCQVSAPVQTEDAAIYVSGTVGTLTNSSTIIGNNAINIEAGANVAAVVNNPGGLISNQYMYEVVVNNGTIATFTNSAGATITGYTAIDNRSNASIVTLNNSGELSGQNGIVNAGTITSLNNLADGKLSNYTGVTNAVGGTIGSLSNAGTITGNFTGIANSGLIQRLNNDGYLSAREYVIDNQGTIGTLNNTGKITVGIDNRGGETSIALNNTGSISSIVNTGTLNSSMEAVINAGRIDSLTNNGLISGGTFAIQNAQNAVLGTIVNSGTIAGDINSVSGKPLRFSGGQGSTFGVLTGLNGATGTLMNAGADVVFLDGNQLLDDNVVVGASKVANVSGNLQINRVISIFGNYAQYAEATLLIGVGSGAVANGTMESDTGYGRLVVSGSANIAPGSAVALKNTAAYAFAPGQRFVVIDAATAGTNYNEGQLKYSMVGVKGTVTGAAVANGDRSDLVLTVTSVDADTAPTTPTTPTVPTTPPAPKIQATTPNAYASLSGLSRYTGISDPGLLNLFNAATALQLGGAAASNRAGAQLSPSAPGASSQAVSAPTLSVLNIIAGRSDSLRLAQADARSGVSTGEAGPKWATWGQAFGGHASQSERDSVDGYSANFGGFLIGVDRAINDAWRAGGVFSYTNTTINSTGNTDGNRTRVNAFGLMGYASYIADTWYGNLSAGVVQQRYDTNRSINFTGFSGNTNAQFNGTQYVARAEAGYPLALPFATVTPVAALTYSYLHQASYTESGGNGAALAVNAANTTSVTSDLGVKISREFATSYGKVVPELQVGWRHQYDNSRSATNARFVADPSGATAFTSLGAQPASDLALVTAGVTLLRANNLSVTARYELQVGGGLVAQAGTLRLRQLF